MRPWFETAAARPPHHEALARLLAELRLEALQRIGIAVGGELAFGEKLLLHHRLLLVIPKRGYRFSEKIMLPE